MTVKLVLLKSGENIVSDVKEGFFEDKLVCYLLENPCTVSVNGSYRVIGGEDLEKGNKVSISLTPWPSFSKETTVELIPDWIVTITNPKDELKLMYETEVLGIEQNENNQISITDEQSDSNQSD
jgi:hypothetical protein